VDARRFTESILKSVVAVHTASLQASKLREHLIRVLLGGRPGRSHGRVVDASIRGPEDAEIGP
jgi:hypothetical protein